MSYKLVKRTLFAPGIDVRKVYEHNRYGDHTEDAAFRYLLTARCHHCGTRIMDHKQYYRVKDRCFCMGCEEFAHAYIIECFKDYFLYENNFD